MFNSSVFETALEIIKSKNGKCLTDHCINQYEKIDVQCKFGHQWKTNSKNIKSGRWCPLCYNARRSSLKIEGKINQIRQFLENKNGKLISEEYFGRYKPLIFQCQLGHQWQSNWSNIVSGHWCHICSKEKIIAGNKKGRKRPPIKYKYYLNDVQKIASNKGGVCLSTVISRRLRFKCALGHEWETSIGNIINANSWCPICASFLYERICRLYFETLFNQKFPTSYPPWLKNEKGNQLELDGYCGELGLAFEHNGKQHYQRIKSSWKDRFEQIQKNDQCKIDLCKQNNVTLIIIPELFTMTKINDLKELIFNQCKIMNHKIPENFWDIEVNYNNVYLSNKETELFNRLKKNLLDHGYELLSDRYFGAHFKYETKCLKCGNIKTRHYSSLTKQCTKCLGLKKRNSLQNCVILASKKNGVCLSDKYINNHSKMKWKCSLNHEWESTFNCIQSGCWCPICAKKIKK